MERIKRNPIYSDLQWPSCIEGGPNHYWVTGHFGMIYHNEFRWLLFDFCRMHQIVYKEIGHIDEHLDNFLQENKENLNLSGNPKSEEDFYKELQTSRMLDGIIAQEHENRGVIRFIDQMAVVGLWALSEQFLGRIYREYIAVKDSIDADTVTAPYKWNDFIDEYKSIGIDLSLCDNFQDANECRLVNNAIKHHPVIVGKLAEFPYFTSYKGKRIMEITLDMQRYLNGISNFLGSLFEKVDTKLKDSNN
ncbi:hypothetical protein [Nostoc sp. MS1]|uniref:hypothetical protein n=1 Tax=Nostoc sp. MS1 TaxID=2764711 RepID=UPI001CC781FC|nr:hypothetical protein [Nostoc sp. MS1]